MRTPYLLALISAVVSARVLILFAGRRRLVILARGRVVVFFAGNRQGILFDGAGFAAGASAAIVTIARSCRFAAQGFKLIPWLDVITVEGFGEAFFFGLDEDHHLVAHGQNVNDLTFALGCDDALVAFGKCLACFDILLIFVDETTAQASTHACDLVGGQRDALVFCHLDGDGGEVGQEFGTAAGFDAAGTHTADDLRHITRTDLPHFNVSVGVDVLYIPFEGFEIDLVFALRAEEEGEARTIVVIFGSNDLDTFEMQFGGAGATVDHGFGLFGLPGLEQ